MPPREEDGKIFFYYLFIFYFKLELDPVTLMNQGLMNIEDKTSEGFKKLNHLLQNPPFPPETFPNLLLLYCKYSYYDMAADILAENTDLTFKTISGDDFEFIDALILTAGSPEESYKKF